MQIFIGLLAYLTGAAALLAGLFTALMIYVAIPDRPTARPTPQKISAWKERKREAVEALSTGQADTSASFEQETSDQEASSAPAAAPDRQAASAPASLDRSDEMSATLRLPQTAPLPPNRLEAAKASRVARRAAKRSRAYARRDRDFYQYSAYAREFENDGRPRGYMTRPRYAADLFGW